MAGAYQAQLNPGGMSNFTGAPAEGLAAPIAGALEYGGELMDQEIHRRRELDRDLQASVAGVALAQASSDIDKAAIDARTHAAPGGAGHTQSIDQMIEARSTDALSQIKDPRIRQVFTQRWADLKGQISTREYGWEAGQRVNFQTTNVKNIAQIGADDQTANPDPTALPNQFSNIDSTIDAMSVDADTKDALKKELKRPLVLGMAKGLVDKDPTYILGDPDNGVKGLLQEPELYHYLDAGDIDGLRNEAGVEQRRRDAQARLQLALGKAQAVETIAVLKKKASSGVVLTADEISQGTGLAKQFSLDGDEWDLGVIKDQNDVNRQYEGASPAILHHDINELQAKVAAGKASEAEQVHLKNLTDYAGPAIARFNADPYAAAAAAGNAAPVIEDLQNPDPKQIQARVTWARSWAATAGLVNVPYLSNDEAKIVTDRMKQGPAGQLEVTAALRNAFGGSIATSIVKQLAPGNKDVELMVGLHPRVAELYRNGVSALAGKTVHLGSTQDQATGQADRQAMNDQFNAIADAIPPEMQPAVRAAAENIAAGIAAEKGNHEPTGGDLQIAFYYGLQRALGRLGDVHDFNAKGGGAEINGRYAWLPQNVSSNEALTRIARAGKADWEKAGGGGLYYLGGNGKATPLTDSQLSQLNSKYQLELYIDPSTRATTPGIYMLVAPGGGHVVAKDGSPWHFDIRNLR
jgi:hypothetical protein